MSPPWIPYSRPEYTEEDRALVSMAMAPMEDGRKPGDMARRFEEALAARINVPPDWVLATSSASAALHIVYNYLLADSMPVHAPILTWPSSYVTAPSHRLCDVDPRRGTLHPLDMKHTNRAICYVELWGQALMTGDEKALERTSNPVVVDAAHYACGPHHEALLKNHRHWFVVYSFNSIKEISADHGGALIGSYVSRHRRMLEAVRDSGTIGRDFLEKRGCYFEMGELNAVLALNQLRHFTERRKQRVALLVRYRNELGPTDIRVRGESGHLCVLIFPSEEARDRARGGLSYHRIRTTIHYPLPLYIPPTEFPIAHDLTRRILTVPLHLGLNQYDVERICRIILESQ